MVTNEFMINGDRNVSTLNNNGKVGGKDSYTITTFYLKDPKSRGHQHFNTKNRLKEVSISGNIQELKKQLEIAGIFKAVECEVREYAVIYNCFFKDRIAENSLTTLEEIHELDARCFKEVCDVFSYWYRIDAISDSLYHCLLKIEGEIYI